MDHETNFPTVEQLQQWQDQLLSMPPATTQAERVDRIRASEELKSALSAFQASETVAFEKERLAEEQANGVAKVRRGKGLASEIGLARKQSASRGTQHLNTARALTSDLPNTMDALSTGEISEEHAQKVVTETSWLAPELQRAVDAHLVGKFSGQSPKELAAQARRQAQRLDQRGAVERAAKAAGQRRVSVRPAPENMAYLTALLPMQAAVGTYATLHRDASRMIERGTAGDPAVPESAPRTRDQVMADLLVERATGQSAAEAVPAEVLLVMTDSALFNADDTDSEPAWLVGRGPLPAVIAQHWLAHPDALVKLRRIYTRPDDGQLLSMDGRSRKFPEVLRKLITMRDDTCRTPYCGAPIREIDHIIPVRDGGATSWANSSGLCSACNQTKENNGWKHSGGPDGLTITTPTGHQYTTITPPPIPGRPPIPSKPPDTRPPPDQPDLGPDFEQDDDDGPDINGPPTICHMRQRIPIFTLRVDSLEAWRDDHISLAA